MKIRVLLRIILDRYGLWLVGGLLLVLVLVTVVRKYRREPEMDWKPVSAFGIQLPMRYDIHGIDVSRHNARIDWERVRQVEGDGVRLQFVFIKATEGATLADRSFDRNWAGAQTAKLRRGAYHFYHPTRDPLKQAANFIQHVTLQPGDFAPVVDFETVNRQSDSTIINGLRLWLETVEEHYNARPIIYTNGNLYKRYIKGNLDKYPLWIADYSAAHLRTYPADNLYFWQHSDAGAVRGIRGRVDFNAFVMDDDELSSVCMP